jgi:lipid II:glycine glycyltransferase (peptidoglycan interpeptide bridge formation enzyme)
VSVFVATVTFFLSMSEHRLQLGGVGKPGLTVRVATAEERGRWDAFVEAAPTGHLLQSWAWGEFKARFGWQAVRLVAEQAGEVVAGAQMLFRRLTLFSLAYVPRGPIVDPAAAAAPVLCAALHREARRRRAIFLKIEPNLPEDEAPSRLTSRNGGDLPSRLTSRNGGRDGKSGRDGASDEAAFLTGLGFRPSAERVQPRTTIVVDLTTDLETIAARQKPKWRYNIGLAARRGVTVRQGSAADLAIFYELLRQTGQRDRFAIHSLAYYQEFFRHLGDQARLFLAEYQGKILAGIVITVFGRQAIYMYGASSGEQRNLMPNHLLQWEAMKWAREQGCTTYDLWGIPDEVTSEVPSEVPSSKFQVPSAASEERETWNLERGTGPEVPSEVPSSKFQVPSAASEERETWNVERGTGLWGVYRFKQGFGGQVTRYAGAFDYVYSPVLYKLWTQLLPRYRGLAARQAF